jgi:D-3-phosphoglycerate dehydrogenase / 2-oxoglutarate reductase
MKKTLLSLAPVPVQQLKILVQRAPGVPEFDVIDGHDMSEEELAKPFARADVVLGTWTFKRIGKDLVAKAGPLKLIQQPSVGYDNIDIKACSERGIRVANAPTGNTVTVAEHTIAMGLALARKLAPANSSVREGRWERLTLEASELGGKIWGVVGLGEIGRAVALRLRPFGLAKVLYYDPHRTAKELEEQYGVEYSPLPALLKSSDIVSLHAPLTESTRNMIGADALSSMKSTAYLINVSRGRLVDEAALADALLKQVIAGAATDVFVEEPPDATDPLLKVPEDKILFSPHIAGLSPESLRRIMMQSAENIARSLAGQGPLYVVNLVQLREASRS